MPQLFFYLGINPSFFSGIDHYMEMFLAAATLKGCQAEQLNNVPALESILRKAVEAGEFQLIHCFMHAFQPQGVTGSIVLAESHLALHSWPELGEVFIEAVTCTNPERTLKALSSICQAIPHISMHWHVHPHRENKILRPEQKKICLASFTAS